MYIYICHRIYIHTYMHTCICMYTYVYTYICASKCAVKSVCMRHCAYATERVCPIERECMSLLSTESVTDTKIGEELDELV